MKSKTTLNLTTSRKKNNYETGGKFLLCCTRPPGTPLVAISSVRSVQGCTDELKEPVFTYVAAGEKRGMVLPRALPETAVVDDCGKRKKKKKGGGKKLLRLFKAVLSESLLAKKLKKRRVIRKQKQASKGTFSAESEKSESFNESSISQETMDIGSGRIFSSTASSSLGDSSHSSAITSSSARSSSSSSNSKSFSDRIKSFTDRNRSLFEKSKSFADRNKSFRISTLEKEVPMKENNQENMQIQEYGKGYYGPGIGLCFVLISLFVLVFWGKCWAILCTSTWLFLVPHLAINKNSPQ